MKTKIVFSSPVKIKIIDSDKSKSDRFLMISSSQTMAQRFLQYAVQQ